MVVEERRSGGRGGNECSLKNVCTVVLYENGWHCMMDMYVHYESSKGNEMSGVQQQVRWSVTERRDAVEIKIGQRG